MATMNFQAIMELAPQILRLPTQQVWANYDEEADTLYLNFKKPSYADDTELTDDDVLIRYEKGEVIGVSILHARRRFPVTAEPARL